MGRDTRATPPGPLQALCAPATYGVPGPVLVRETHASWVFLAGEWAYKVKKPVRLAFLDYETLARRHAACREELRVNRALADGIYEEVVAVVPEGDGVRFAPEGTPGAIEYAIRMRRFDESLTLKGAIERGALGEDAIRQVARRIATFHETARPSSAGGARETLARWEENVLELEQLAGAELPARSMRRFGRAFVSGHEAEIERRARAGRVRDGHGDLRCEHVLIGEEVRVVDRIEFDAALREIDVGWDLAFLIMDLHARGCEDATHSLLSEYRRAGGDPGSRQLVSFYCAHWALVRAKVAILARGAHLGSDDPSPETLLDLARRFCWQAREPMAVIVCGAPASGKSTLAAELSRQSGWPVVSSDETRKRLAGLAPTQRAAPEHYTSEFSRRTYRELGMRAAAALGAGGGVLVDASCAKRFERTELLGPLDATGAPRLFLECRVQLETALARAGAREREPSRVSDATPEIVTRKFRGYEPIGEVAGDGIAIVDCESPVERQVGSAIEALDAALGARREPAT